MKGDFNDWCKRARNKLAKAEEGLQVYEDMVARAVEAKDQHLAPYYREKREAHKRRIERLREIVEECDNGNK